MTRAPLHRRIGLAFRLAARAVRGTGKRNAYSGAAVNRLLLDWIASARSADEEIRGDLRLLRARARELARNNTYAKRYLRLLGANVIGYAGIKLQAIVRELGSDDLDVETNREIERAWREWAEGPVTVDGKLSLRRFEEVILRTLAVDGEAFVRIWRGSDVNRFGLALQAIDADLIDERLNRSLAPGVNEIRLGVEVDKVGRPLAYHVYDKPLSVAATTYRERFRVPAGDVIHLYVPDRVNQTRGVTWLHSVMIPVHMLDGYEESEAIASRVASAKMGFFVRTQPEIGGGLSMVGDDDEGETKPVSLEASPGSFEVLDDGLDFKAWDPAHPTGAFGPFVNQMIRKIASGLSVFANVLGNDARGVNYSSFRSFALIERDDWRQIQGDFVELWRRPLYREWIKIALLTKALRLRSNRPDDFLAVRHRPRGWPWIDPQKEAQGAILAIENQLSSRTSALAEKGIEIEDVFAEIKTERELAAKYGIELKTSAPAPAPPVTIEEVEEVVEESAAAGGNGAADDDEDGTKTIELPDGGSYSVTYT